MKEVKLKACTAFNFTFPLSCIRVCFREFAEAAYLGALERIVTSEPVINSRSLRPCT
jgi:hypothetical protein